jgi:hypothetical protein
MWYWRIIMVNAVEIFAGAYASGGVQGQWSARTHGKAAGAVEYRTDVQRW